MQQAIDATIREMIEAARDWRKADIELQKECGTKLDPVACTIYAKKGMHLDRIPPVARVAAQHWMRLVDLHGVLVNIYGMDAEIVRAYWSPILSSCVESSLR